MYIVSYSTISSYFNRLIEWQTMDNSSTPFNIMSFQLANPFWLSSPHIMYDLFSAAVHQWGNSDAIATRSESFVGHALEAQRPAL